MLLTNLLIISLENLLSNPGARLAWCSAIVSNLISSLIFWYKNKTLPKMRLKNLLNISLENLHLVHATCSSAIVSDLISRLIFWSENKTALYWTTHVLVFLLAGCAFHLTLTESYQCFLFSLFFLQYLSCLAQNSWYHRLTQKPSKSTSPLQK